MKFKITFPFQIKNSVKDFFIYASKIVSFALLSLVYISGGGVSFLLAKILKKELLDLSVNKNKQSYWQEIDQRSAKEYFKQF